MKSTRTGHRWAAVTVGATLMMAAAIAAPAQTFTTLYSFRVVDGESPEAALVQATNGNLYGTAINGGTGD